MANEPNHDPTESVTIEQSDGWMADAAIFRLMPVYIDKRTTAAARIDFQLERRGGTTTSVRLTIRAAKALVALLQSYVDEETRR